MGRLDGRTLGSKVHGSEKRTDLAVIRQTGFQQAFGTPDFAFARQENQYAAVGFADGMRDQVSYGVFQPRALV